MGVMVYVYGAADPVTTTLSRPKPSACARISLETGRSTVYVPLS